MDTHQETVLLARAEVVGLVGEVAEMLDEYLDAEADSEWHWDATTADQVANRLATLTFSLKELFHAEEAGDLRVLARSSRFTDELIQLRVDHVNLLDQLDRVFDMTGSPLRGSFGWSDIERSFREFVAQLADHDAREIDVWNRVVQKPQNIARTA